MAPSVIMSLYFFVSFCHCNTLNPYSSIYVLDKNSGSTHGEAGRILKGSQTPKPKASISLDRTDVFATVLFTEFLKELAAFAQEHSILSYIPMEE